jgi:hypothetical protein
MSCIDGSDVSIGLTFYLSVLPGRSGVIGRRIIKTGGFARAENLPTVVIFGVGGPSFLGSEKRRENVAWVGWSGRFASRI